jgi:hypothetical protein
VAQPARVGDVPGPPRRRACGGDAEGRLAQSE